MLAGAALRFATIASQSYWYDEATTVRELHMSFGGLLHAVAHRESTPPLYYVLAWVWAKAFGTGEAGLRSLSALAGVGTIPVAYMSGCDLVSRATGLLAAAFTALSPFLIWYSQEARAYMLLGLLCGLSFLFFVKALREPTTRNVGWWAACSSLALLTHFFAGFVVAPEAVWLLAALRSRRVLIAVAVVAVVQAALIPLLVTYVGHPLLGWIKQYPLSVRIEQVPVAFGLGTLYLDGTLSNQGLLIGGLIAVRGGARLVRRRPRWAEGSADRRHRARHGDPRPAASDAVRARLLHRAQPHRGMDPARRARRDRLHGAERSRSVWR